MLTAQAMESHRHPSPSLCTIVHSIPCKGRKFRSCSIVLPVALRRLRPPSLPLRSAPSAHYRRLQDAESPRQISKGHERREKKRAMLVDPNRKNARDRVEAGRTRAIRTSMPMMARYRRLRCAPAGGVARLQIKAGRTSLEIEETSAKRQGDGNR